MESSKPTCKKHPQVPSSCHISIRPLQCLLGENARVFIAWWVIAYSLCSEHRSLPPGLSQCPVPPPQPLQSPNPRCALLRTVACQVWGLQNAASIQRFPHNSDFSFFNHFLFSEANEVLSEIQLHCLYNSNVIAPKQDVGNVNETVTVQPRTETTFEFITGNLSLWGPLRKDNCRDEWDTWGEKY